MRECRGVGVVFVVVWFCTACAFDDSPCYQGASVSGIDGELSLMGATGTETVSLANCVVAADPGVPTETWLSVACPGLTAIRDLRVGLQLGDLRALSTGAQFERISITGDDVSGVRLGPAAAEISAVISVLRRFGAATDDGVTDDFYRQFRLDVAVTNASATNVDGLFVVLPDLQLVVDFEQRVEDYRVGVQACF